MEITGCFLLCLFYFSFIKIGWKILRTQDFLRSVTKGISSCINVPRRITTKIIKRIMCGMYGVDCRFFRWSMFNKRINGLDLLAWPAVYPDGCLPDSGQWRVSCLAWVGEAERWVVSGHLVNYNSTHNVVLHRAYSISVRLPTCKLHVHIQRTLKFIQLSPETLTLDCALSLLPIHSNIMSCLTFWSPPVGPC